MRFRKVIRMRYIETLKDGDRVSEIFLVKNKTLAMTKTGKEYENVILQDKTGALDGKIWDPTSGGIGDYDVLDYVDVYGLVTSFNGTLQLKIERLRKVSEDEYNPSDYLPVSRFDIEDMYHEFLGYIIKIENSFIKKLLESFFVEDEDIIKKFKSVSAAKSVHHGFVGGLLEHSLSVTRLAEKYADTYEILNKDLLVATAMLHDIGKVKEFSPFPENDYTDDGNLLGHIVIGSEMVGEKIKLIDNFPGKLASEVKHCILSHHGELEFGSPKKPALAEAVALSMADNFDAKMETMRELLESKDETQEWMGYSRWFESNIKRTSI